MIDQLIALIVDESKWLTFSMGLALLAVAVLLVRYRTADLDGRRRVLAAMNLFFGVTIGGMAFGHLLAVTTKLLVGSLEGSSLLFYGIGLVLIVPAIAVILHTRKLVAADDPPERTTLAVNGWLAISLLALGLPNLALALPGLLNLGHRLIPNRYGRWAVVAAAVVVNGGLFIGSLVFLASGQSFEQFSGM